MRALSAVEGRILEEVQRDFPLTSRPFRDIGARCGLSEDETISFIRTFIDDGFIRDVSALLNSSALGYKSTLVAARVEEEYLDDVVARVSDDARVGHNYLRNGDPNLWFTFTVREGEDFGEEVGRLLDMEGIAMHMILPSVKIFKIGVIFRFSGASAGVDTKPGDGRTPPRVPLTEDEKSVIRALQGGMTIEENPWLRVARRAGKTEERVFEIVGELKRRGVIKRVSAVLRHRRVGFDQNGMVCFALPPGRVEEAGEKLSRFPEVTHCYQRETLPEWPYNLYVMIHGRTRRECERVIARMSGETACSRYRVLYSTREFKKERIHYTLE